MEIVVKEKMTLPEITRAANDVAVMLMENGGELTPEIEKFLSELDLKTKAKVDGYALMIERMKLEQGFWKEQAEAASAIAKACEAVGKRIKGAILNTMGSEGIEEISGNLKRAVLTSTAGSLDITDAEAIPEEFKMKVTQTVIDTEKVRAALDAMEDVPGARIKGGLSIRFYNVKPGKVEVPAKPKLPKKPRGKARPASESDPEQDEQAEREASAENDEKELENV